MTPRRRALSQRAASSFVVCAVAALSTACTNDEPRAARHPRAHAAAAEPVPTADRALAYTPGDGPTDRLIAMAQDGVRHHPESVDGYVGLAVLFIRHSRETGDTSILRLADDAVRAARARAPTDPHVLSLSAMLLQEQHRFTEALAVADELLLAHPDDTTGHIVRGDALLELGRYDDAAEAYQRAIDLRPDLRSYNRGGYIRWLTGDVDGALELYELAVDAGSPRDPESMAWCMVDIGELRWHQGALAAAADAVARALRLVPDYLPALRLRARVERAQGRGADAIATMTAILGRRELVEDLLMLSELLDDAGRTDDAHAKLARAEQLSRDDPRALAVYDARHGRATADAVRFAEHELRSRPDNIYGRDAHALTLARAGRNPEARAEMDRAMALGTPDERLFLHDALVRALAGDPSGAAQSLAHANSLNPNGDPFLAHDLAARLATTP